MHDRLRVLICRRVTEDRSGAMLVMVAISVLLVLIFLAMSVDLAYMQLTRTELKIASDAAARAAVETLSREQDVTKAIQAAKNIALANEVAGTPLQLAENDIVPGRVEFSTSGKWTFTANGSPTNSIQVLAKRTNSSSSGPINLFFGGASGHRTFEPQATSTATNLDRDVALIVDHSGSMRNYNRWRGLKNAVDIFLQELDQSDPTEHVSLSGYSTETSLYQPLTGNTNLIRRALSRLRPGGMTNIGGGLRVGSNSLEDPVLKRSFAARVVVLMTDGNHNRGTNPLSVTSLTLSRGHVVHTVTFGSSANSSLMRQVAQRTGGNYYHAPTNRELVKVFREIALTLPVLLVD